MEPETLATIDPNLQVFRLMQTVTELRRELLTERECAFHAFNVQSAVIAELTDELVRLRRVMREEVEPLAREVLTFCAQWERGQGHSFRG